MNFTCPCVVLFSEATYVCMYVNMYMYMHIRGSCSDVTYMYVCVSLLVIVVSLVDALRYSMECYIACRFTFTC